MPMAPFFSRFRDLAFKEMRTLSILEDGSGIPRGDYGLLELYCDEPGCDCRRVHIQVVARAGFRVLAHISYGWEPDEFYERWGMPLGLGREAGPFLDPLNEQSEFAPAFLDLVDDLVLADEDYVRRLIRHYGMFKGQQTGEAPKNRAARRREQRRQSR